MDTRAVQRPIEVRRFKDTRGQRGQKGSKFSFATVITGGGAGLAEGLACHPLDTIKVKMQLAQKFHQGSRAGVFQTGYQIAKLDSTRALYRGLGPVLVGIVPKMAVRFTCFEAYKSLLCDSKTGALSDRSLLMSALAAGVTEAVLVVTPMEVIKIRLQSQKLPYPGRMGSQSRIRSLFATFRAEGFGSLYSGMGLTALRQGSNQAANLFAYTKITKALCDWQPQYKDSRLPIYQVTLVGLVAGSMGPLCNGPIDTLKTCVQQGPRLPGQSQTAHVIAITKMILRNDGILGLYKGLLPRIMRVGVGQAVTFPVYELLNQALRS